MTQRLLWLICIVAALSGSYGAARADDEGKCEVCAAEPDVCAQINDKLPRCAGCKEAKVPCAGCTLVKPRPCGACKDTACDACKEKPACALCALKKKAVAGTFCCAGCESDGKGDSCAKCKDMRAKVTEAAKQVGCAVCDEGAQRAEKDGVTAAVAHQGRRVQMDQGALLVVPDYYTFHVAIKNGNDAKKTLKGKVVLLDAEGKEVGAGTLFQKLGPGETAVKVYHWKGSSPPVGFKVEVEKIFNF